MKASPVVALERLLDALGEELADVSDLELVESLADLGLTARIDATAVVLEIKAIIARRHLERLHRPSDGDDRPAPAASPRRPGDAR